jgi:periplasmic protein TonB
VTPSQPEDRPPNPDSDARSLDAPDWRGVRTILVPPDIVGVKRRAAAWPQRRTPLPWHPTGTVTTARAGAREWFGDRVFVEPAAGHGRVGFGTSVALHVCCGAALVALLLGRAGGTMPAIREPLLFIHAMVSVAPAVSLAAGQPTPAPQPRPAQVQAPAAAAPPPLAAELDARPAAAPTEAPTGIAPETGIDRNAGSPQGVAGGVPGGIPGGVVGGVPGGVVGGLPGATTPTAVRIGAGMEPPRKIKDARPVYPEGALPGRAQGAVVIDLTIGPDGKVQDAKVVHSVPLLDKAALDAVRQWEYAPPMLNGVPIAVVITVVVNFAMR